MQGQPGAEGDPEGDEQPAAEPAPSAAAPETAPSAEAPASAGARPARSRRKARREKREKVRKTGYRRIIDYPRTGRRGWRALIPSARLVFGIFATFVLLLFGFIAVVYAEVRTPDINSLKMPTATVYEYSDGTIFFTAGIQNRVLVPISQIPPTMQHAIVSVENPTFFTDAGISPRGLLRALVNDVEGGPLQGGSTITQQFVKNAYLNDRQTFGRKFTEIFEAVKITRTYSKDQILDDYLNTVYFGRGSYGIDAAAETYFGVPVSQITDPARAAYLAALVNEPTVLSQTTPAAQAQLKARWNLVLDDMVKTGDITPAQKQAALWPATRPRDTGIIRDANGVDESAMAQVANGYLDQLHKQNPAVPDAATAAAGGDVIVTTFSQADMTAAVRAVNTQLYGKLNPNDSAQAAVDKGAQVGLATVDAATGELLGFYPGSSDFDNATQAQIEPGSQMQAFQFVSGFDRQPTSRHAASPLWTLMSRIGLTQNPVANPAELPEPLSKLESDPDLALGITPESPARMAAAFTVFPDHGVYHGLATALSVSVDGRKVWSYDPAAAASNALPPFAADFGLKVLAARGGATAAYTTGDGGNQVRNGQADAQPPGPTGANTYGIPSTIGGDNSTWYSGFVGDLVTSVGVWDQSVNTKNQVVQRSLNGLGGVSAQDSVEWPTGIWNAYMAAITPSSPPARVQLTKDGQDFAQPEASAPVALAPTSTPTSSPTIR